MSPRDLRRKKCQKEQNTDKFLIWVEMLVEFWTRTERIMPAGIKKVEDLYMMDNDRVFMRTVVSLDPNRI